MHDHRLESRSALASSPEPGDAAVPGRRSLASGRLGPEGQSAQRTALARASIEDARQTHLPALRSSIAGRRMKEARHAADALRGALSTIETELRGASDPALLAEAAALRAEAEPDLALAPPPAPDVPMIDGWIPRWTGGLPEGDAAAEAETESTWTASLDRRDRARVIPFPHQGRLDAALGGFAGRAVVDPEGCARQGAPAFTEDDVAHFASDDPDLLVAAHEATHLLQHAGRTRDAGLGAEGHAQAVAAAITGGEGADDLLGDEGAAVESGVHGFSLPTWAPDADTLAENDSVVPEKTRARKERQYKPKGTLAVKLSDTHYRFWGYDVDSADVRREFRELLARISERWIADHQAVFHITGHTSSSGAEKHNDGLALARAEQIQVELRLLALLRQPMVTHSAGEKHPLVDEKQGPAAMARNRRVEVHVIPGVKEAEQPTTTVFGKGTYDPDKCAPMDPRATVEYCDPPRPPPPPRDPSVHSVDLCATKDEEIAIMKAQIEIWSDPAKFELIVPDAAAFGESYFVPKLTAWWAACKRVGVSDKKRDELHSAGSINIPASVAKAVNDRRSFLEAEVQSLSAACSDQRNEVPRTERTEPSSGEDVCRDQPFWCDPEEPWKEGPMPGDHDLSRNRRY